MGRVQTPALGSTSLHLPLSETKSAQGVLLRPLKEGNAGWCGKGGFPNFLRSITKELENCVFDLCIRDLKHST